MAGKITINEFFVEGGDQEKSHVLLHITEPSTPEEETRGYFFAVCELNNNDTSQIERLQNIIDDLEKNVYSLPPKKNQTVFESALEKANQKGHHITNNKDCEVNCVVGLIKMGSVAFSYHGNPKASLLYYGKKGLDQIPLIDKVEKNASQLFPSTLEGPLKPGDMFVVATPRVYDYASNDNFKTLLSVKGAEEGVKKIQKELDGLDNGLSFGGIVFTNGIRIIDTAAPVNLTNTVRPETKHNRQENATAAKKISEETNYRPRGDRGQTLANAILLNIGRALVVTVVGLYKITKWLVILLWRIAVGLILITTNKAGQRAHVLNTLRSRARAIIKKLEDMPLLAKLSFVGIFVLALIFTGSIFLEKIKAGQIAKENNYRALVQAVIEKINSAESDAIYGDSVKSLETMLEAKISATALPANSISKEQEKIHLLDDIETSLSGLRKIKNVDAELLATVQFAEGASRLALIDNTIVAYNSGDPKFYLVNPLNKSVESKSHENVPNLIADNTPKENDRIIFLNSSGAVAEFDKKTETLQQKNIILDANSKYFSISTYNQRLYAIDPINRQIYRHNRTQTGYDKSSAWIKSAGNDEMSKALSLTIDGDMYVLTAPGGVIKFTNGQRVEFSLKGLDPALDKPTEIWTYNGVNNIYITEPTNKRLVVIDKTGKLVAQYTSKDWLSPTDSIVDETKGIAYVIDIGKIYKIKL